MKKFKILLIVLIAVVGLTFILFKFTNLDLFKRMNATIVDAVPSGSLITDTEFYAELVDSYNKEKGTSYDYTHNFTTSELSSLQTLVVDENSSNYHGHSVSSLTGLSYLTGLKNLTLKNINVTEIDLSNNTELVNLLLDNLKITTLNLKNNNKIKKLDVNVNSLNIVNLGNTNLDGISINKPSETGYILVDLGKTTTYLTSMVSINDNTIKDNSLAIICDKYNLSLNESTTCYIKGKVTEAVNGIVFKLNVSNNLSVSNVQNLSGLSNSGRDYLLYGDAISAGEFNILSFTLTATSSGIGSISLTDYNVQNPIGFISYETDDYIEGTESVTKSFYIDKSVVKNGTNVVSSGILKTNYTLNIVNSNGTYDKAFDIVVLGDVKADGIINIQDVTKSYKALAKHVYTTFTNAEIEALDANNDGKKNAQDIIKIYNSIGE